MAGNHDNTEIAKFIVEPLDLNLSNVTKILNSDANFLKNYVGTGLVENGIVTARDLLSAELMVIMSASCFSSVSFKIIIVLYITFN